MAGNFNYFHQIQAQQQQAQVIDPSRAMATAKSTQRAPSQVPPSNVIASAQLHYLPVTSGGATQYYDVTANPNIGAWLQLQSQGQAQQTVHLQQVILLFYYRQIF